MCGNQFRKLDSRQALKQMFKCFFLIYCVFLLEANGLISQSINKEKINAIIKELSPTYTIEKSYKNIDIFGFDVLDKNMNRLTSSKFIFYPGKQFSIVLFGRRKITYGKSPMENRIERCDAALEHQDGGYFWSLKTAYYSGAQKIDGFSREWQIGGIYKVQFSFRVPEFSLPGKYILRIAKANRDHPIKDRIIEFNKIKIIIKRHTIHKSRQNEEHSLPIEECLLNPAAQGKREIILRWTGDIKFFLDKDIKTYRKIIINARGTPLQRVYPLLKVYVDNTEVGSVYLNKEWNNYEFDINIDKQSHILKIRFDNNASSPSENRDMYIKYVKLVR